MRGEDEVAQVLRTLEEELLSPSARRDAGRLRTLLAESFEEVGASGRVFGREEIIGLLADEAKEDVSRSLEGFRALPLGEGLVQVRYRSGARSGGELRVAERCSLWKRQGAGWQMLFHQGTPCRSMESQGG